ncbi:hypothetical protein GCM10011571_09190 [Marinithermofilum abyssi]|uniref:Uncharacterized protein n=1 Tax=Marinithermofilum abyssi TaxID=1571185 RepID=A0A8J2VGL2_9BACL|nr:hypothetical protein [Marinithermofilum abyssi]GGE10046.1 hypothetical protein GCM10011571_09190 [Marinithermofilum abyssi]
MIGYTVAYSGLLDGDNPLAGQETPYHGPQRIAFNQGKPTAVALHHQVKGPARVEGELVQKELQPFHIQLSAPDTSFAFGLRSDKEGRLQLYQSGEGIEHVVKQSDASFSLKPNQKYRVQLLHIPDEPLRVAVTDPESGKRWVAAGTVAMEGETYQAEIEGMKGTIYQKDQVTPVRVDQAKLDWMNHYPWNLVYGEGTIEGSRLVLPQDTLVKVSGTSVFHLGFRRSENYLGQPFQGELESVDGTRFQVLWDKDSNLKLVDASDGEKVLATKSLGWEWDPEKDADLKVSTENNRLRVQLKQGDRIATLTYQHDEPLAFRDLSIKSPAGLELINPSS